MGLAHSRKPIHFKDLHTMRDHIPEFEDAFFDIFADYLDLERNTSRKYSGGEYNLDRMAELAALAGHPEQQFRQRLFHVAGTKGKGATCLFLSALLRTQGLHVGTFMSPHLATVRERFRLDTQLISYEQLLPVARHLEKAVRTSDLTPTFFELMTVLGLRIFADAHCDWAILETGIGGLLDSTNYVQEPACSVITAISYDHTQLLGDTIQKIASQKAGIIKPGIPIVCGPQPYPAAEHVIRQAAYAKGAPFHPAEPVLQPETWGMERLPPFLAEDFATALTACRIIGIEAVPQFYHSPELRARCEVIQKSPLVVLDAAHNADSAKRLAEAVGTLYPEANFVIILGVVAGKDAAGIFEHLLPISSEFVLTNPRSQKGSELDTLVSSAEHRGVNYTVIPAIRSITDLPPGRNLLFTGSFFTALIGEDLFDYNRASADSDTG